MTKPYLLYFLLVTALSPVFASDTTKLKCSVPLKILATPNKSFEKIWWDEESFFGNFEPFQRILSLADDSTSYDSRQIARKFPGKKIVSTDKWIKEPDQFSPQGSSRILKS